MMTARTLIAALTIMAFSAAAPAAFARPKTPHVGPRFPASKQVIELAGFSSNGRYVVLKITDENLGTLFQVRASKDGDLVKTYRCTVAVEKGTFAALRHKYHIPKKLKASPENPRKKVTMMTAVKGGTIHVYMMRGKEALEYTQIPLFKPKKGDVQAYVKQMAWGPRGRYAIIIYHQKIKDLLTWDGDFAKMFEYHAYRLSFGQDASGSQGEQ